MLISEVSITSSSNDFGEVNLSDTGEVGVGLGLESCSIHAEVGHNRVLYTMAHVQS